MDIDLKDYNLVDIISVENYGYNNTYDLEVEDIHLFNARNDLCDFNSISHNSALITVFDKDDDKMLNAKTNFKVLRKIGFEKNIKKNGDIEWEGRVIVDSKYDGFEGMKYDVVLTDYEYNDMLCKQGVINWFHVDPQRARSNNSVLLVRKDTKLEDFKKIVEKIKHFGEPGFVFADEDNGTLVNPCFHKDTRIHTDKGLIRIEDLAKTGDVFNTCIDNRIGKLNELYKNNFGVSVRQTSTSAVVTQKNVPIFELITEHGHAIRLTENHEFITSVGRKKLNELNVGDTIYIQSGVGKFGEIGNFNQGFLLGLIAGDGTFNEDSAILNVWEEDFEYTDKIHQMVLEETKSIKKKCDNGKGINWATKTPSSISGVKGKQISSVQLFNLIKMLGVENPKDIKVKVPECIWRGTKDMVIGYLQGLIFSDGSVSLCKGKSKAHDTLVCDINQSNKKLLQEIQILLQNLGVSSRLYKTHDKRHQRLPDGKGGYASYICKANYKLSINRGNLIHFISKYPLYGRKQQKILGLLKQRGYDCRKQERFITKVKSIDYVENGDVYCFTQPKTNTTIANGLVVGQCAEIRAIPITSDGVCGVQMCNLTSMNGKKIINKETFKTVVKAATIIGTLQAGYTDFKYLSPAAKKLTDEEALLGVSITGFMEHPDILLDSENQKEMAQYAVKINKDWSKKIGINQAARVTCVKPEGCQTFDTIIKTSVGDITFQKIFELNGYNIEDFKKYEDGIFLPITEKIMVKDKDNEWQYISNLYVRGMSKTIKIEMEDGKIINCTPNHQFLLKNGQWKRADELSDIDEIVNY